jgi:dTDP-4-dehydrorhamnose reductase
VKRVLLIGGTGQLGTAIRRRWNDCEIIAPTHAQLGLEQSAQLGDALDRIRPDVLVNAAAFHDVDRCEEEPEAALRINGTAVGRAAQLASQHGAVFVTISTDYVFDGTSGVPYREDARAHPLSLYGLSKLVGEHLAQRGARVFVVRTCGLYGAKPARSPSTPLGTGSVEGRRPFIERVLSRASDAAPMRVVADVVASPTFAGDLAAALAQLIATDAYGLYHAVNAGAVSWYDFACAAAKAAGHDGGIEPIGADEWKMRAVRPRYSALENAKLHALGIVMPSWRAGIAAYLAERGIQGRL